ncbi:MAG: hypothetical protein SV765_08765 [Pseudomonadota bacterium]|nr:hypothetical protein [Pseudomonadales bacterium]MDY6920293.1 hypothetical protein [Pseudomonadota bacterium]
MRNTDSSASFMSEVYRRIGGGNRSRNGSLLHGQSRLVSTMDHSLNPCLLLGLASWLVLYGLYGLLT